MEGYDIWRAEPVPPPKEEPRKDGGSAFPGIVERPAGGVPGMSLRDYFAGQAATGAFRGGDTDIHDATFAQRCYEMADAMLKERAK